MPQAHRGEREKKKGAEATVPRKASTPRNAPPAKKAALRDIADTLYRTAVESGRQHCRYAELVDSAAPDAEQKAALAAVRESDDILDEAVDLYEVACLEESNHADDAWWHRANMVWKAAKEYLRHHALSERMTRCGNGHSRAELVGLSIEYELEASALLRMRHAVEAYRATRPAAGLPG
jgi:hypothetical protein